MEQGQQMYKLENLPRNRGQNVIFGDGCAFFLLIFTSTTAIIVAMSTPMTFGFAEGVKISRKNEKRDNGDEQWVFEILAHSFREKKLKIFEISNFRI